jgi:hypothetical protein
MLASGGSDRAVFRDLVAHQAAHVDAVAGAAAV